MRCRMWILCVCLLLGVLSACAATPAPFKIAVSMALDAPLGRQMMNAIQLAFDENGAKVGAHSLDLLIFNSGDAETPYSPILDARAAQSIASDPSVLAFMSATSDQVKASLPITNQAGMVHLSPTATWPGLTKVGFAPGEPSIYYPNGKRTFFRVVPADDVQGAVGARWAAALGAKTVFILSDDSLYANGLADIFAVNGLDFNLQVLGREQFTQVDVEQVARIIAAAPDLLYMSTTGGKIPVAYTLIKMLRAEGFSAPIMGGDGLIDTTLSSLDALGEVCATQIAPDPMRLERATDFVAAFRARYGETPSPFALSSYEATKVLLRAIALAEPKTRQGVLDAMRQLGSYEGVLGRWQFDANGDTTLTTIGGWCIEDGVWQFHENLR